MKIVTLTLSAAFDIHCDAKELIVDHENIASIMGIDAGGKGINISKALNSFKTASTAIAVLGRENADEFENMLGKEGVRLQKILIDGRIRENITIHTDNGKETRLSFNASAVPDGIMAEVERITDSVCASDTIVTLTGRVPQGISMEDVKKYIASLKSKGIKVVVDSRSFSLSDLKAAKPFLIKPNEEEISLYIGRDVSDLDEAERVAEALREDGIENVMITLGEKGSVIASCDGIYRFKAPKIKAISTIGAGDSSIAGFLYAYTNGFDYKECLRYSVAFGTAACLTSGTNPPKPEDVMKMLEKIN